MCLYVSVRHVRCYVHALPVADGTLAVVRRCVDVTDAFYVRVVHFANMGVCRREVL